VFDHGSMMKLVSAAGLAPAILVQAERVAPTLRADGGPKGVAPQPSRRQQALC